MKEATMDKQKRLELFLSGLSKAPLAATEEDAYRLLADILNDVEELHSCTPYNPSNWMQDGRIYPPQKDHSSEHCPGVTRYRSRRHNIYIAKNGAIRICHSRKNEVLLDKAGQDKKKVDDYEN